MINKSMKNKNSTLLYKDINVDSNEEIQAFYWLDTCKENGLVDYYTYQPKTFALSDAVYIQEKVVSKKGIEKTVNVKLLNEHVYSPDFMIKFSKKFIDLIEENKYLKRLFRGIDLRNNVYIDVKGSFLRNDAGRSFSINKKWMFYKYDILIVKFVPEEIFKETFCPDECFLSPKKKMPVKKFIGFNNVINFLEKK